MSERMMFSRGLHWTSPQTFQKGDLCVLKKWGLGKVLQVVLEDIELKHGTGPFIVISDVDSEGYFTLRPHQKEENEAEFEDETIFFTKI